MNKKAYGFTIVELLIVIVVIGILAAISIVAYNNIQQKSRDSILMQDIATIRKALEMYKTEHGRYPSQVPNPGIIGWEVSSDSGAFISSISSAISSIPEDPTNNPNHHYAYVRDAAASYGCDATAGDRYVLRIVDLESIDGRQVSGLGPCEGSTSLSASRTPTQTQAVFIR